MDKDKPKASPPNLIPENLSPEISQWLADQLQAERDHKREVAARAMIQYSNNSRNIRAS